MLFRSKRYTPQELAAGFVDIANMNMVRAIRKISVAKGYDPADYVLKRFANTELGDVESMVAEAADVLGVFAAQGGEAAQQEAGEATRRLGIAE